MLAVARRARPAVHPDPVPARGCRSSSRCWAQPPERRNRPIDDSRSSRSGPNVRLSSSRMRGAARRSRRGGRRARTRIGGADAPACAERRPTTLPFSSGKSPELIVAQQRPRSRKGEGPAPDRRRATSRSAPLRHPPNPPSRRRPAAPLPNRAAAATRRAEAADAPQADRRGGALGEALQNLQRYMQDQSSTIRTAATQFGPRSSSIRRASSSGRGSALHRAGQAELVHPDAAMSLKGHVVLSSTCTRTGHHRPADRAAVATRRVQQRGVEGAARVESDAAAAAGYPTDKVLFTVTFYYNEAPPR